MKFSRLWSHVALANLATPHIHGNLSLPLVKGTSPDWLSQISGRIEKSNCYLKAVNHPFLRLPEKLVHDCGLNKRSDQHNAFHRQPISLKTSITDQADGKVSRAAVVPNPQIAVFNPNNYESLMELEDNLVARQQLVNFLDQHYKRAKHVNGVIADKLKFYKW